MKRARIVNVIYWEHTKTKFFVIDLQVFENNYLKDEASRYF